MPIKLLVDAATKLCNVSGVDADVFFAWVNMGSFPRFGYAAQRGSDGKVTTVTLLRNSPRGPGGDHPEVEMEAHPVTPFFEGFFSKQQVCSAYMRGLVPVEGPESTCPSCPVGDAYMKLKTGETAAHPFHDIWGQGLHRSTLLKSNALAHLSLEPAHQEHEQNWRREGRQKH